MVVVGGIGRERDKLTLPELTGADPWSRGTGGPTWLGMQRAPWSLYRWHVALALQGARAEDAKLGFPALSGQ